MDFFEYASMADIFAPTKLWVQLLIGGLCFAIVFIFEAIGLYTIAVRNGYKNKWMAFIPFFNTYYIGVCAQKNKFYNVNTKTIGLIAAITEAVLVFLYIFALISGSLVDKYLEKVTETHWLFGEYETYTLNIGAVPDNLQWAAWVYRYMSTYILSILDLVFNIMQIILLLCFFQTYASRRYVLFALTSVLFPIMGILFFIVRNNKGVNYRDFIRAEQARQYQQYQQYQQNFNQNPYNQNPYNRNPYNNTPPSNGGSGSDPFDEFGGNGQSGGTGANSGSDPFEDFDK